MKVGSILKVIRIVPEPPLPPYNVLLIYHADIMC